MSKKTKDLNYLAMSAMLRAREANMLGRDRMDRMLAAGSYGEAAKLLAECGYAYNYNFFHEIQYTLFARKSKGRE